jgi:uncharacterized alpha-E superfamily protein
VWVLPKGEAVGVQAQVASFPPPALERSSLAGLPSRAAETLFWLGRYTERLEQMVRAARHALRCLGDDSLAPAKERLAPLKKVLARLGLILESAAKDGARETLQQEVLRLLFQEERAGGVCDLLKRIHLSAFTVRDRLSADTWRIFNRLDLDARQRPGRLPLVQASGVLDTLVLDLAALSGMEMENMTRGHGWVFLDLGRRIERGIFVARLMEAVWRSESGRDRLLEPALEIADSVMTHRRRYFLEPRMASTMEVLVEDAANPRSLAFQIGSLRNHAAGLPTGTNPGGVAAVQRRVRQLEAQLRALSETAAADAPWAAARTGEALAAFTTGLAELSELLTQVYFSHVTPRVS